jgi:diacylglycerol kinase family enzyme
MAVESTKIALKDGAGTIVAIGGDGTINDVVNGFERLISAEARLAIVPHGTGWDFERLLKLP